MLMGKYSVYRFLTAFGLNLIWENLHSALYVSYKGGPITELILLRAALIDAVIVTAIIFLTDFVLNRWRTWQFSPFSEFSNVYYNGRPLVIIYIWVEVVMVVVLGILVAVVMEKWGLSTGRWVYSAAMPIIPLLGTGLTPTIQLAVTGFFSLLLSHLQKSIL